jgi:hypothetical protein
MAHLSRNAATWIIKSIGMSRKSILLTKALSFAELNNDSVEGIASCGVIEMLATTARTLSVCTSIQ